MSFPVEVDATWVNDPTGTGDPEYDAADLRRADAALVAGDGTSALGVLGGIASHSEDSLAVTVDGSDVVTVKAGAAIIPGDAVAGTGTYRAGIGATTTGNLAARHATNPRIDLVVFRAMDPDVVGAHTSRRGRVEIIAGTPAGSPVAPAKPSLSVELARITVPATGGGAASVDATRRVRTAALGGKISVATAARLPAAAAVGQDALALDTLREYMWTGALWQPKRLTGTRTVTFTSVSSSSVLVDFDEPFAAAPDVQVNIASSVAETRGWLARATAITTTGFTLFVSSADGSVGTWGGRVVKWLATPTT